MMVPSLLLYGRRLCIIIAVIILLFLPLTFTGNNNSNNALAQPHCDVFTNPNWDPGWCYYEREVENYPNCLASVANYNQKAASAFSGLSIPPPSLDASQVCPLPAPPESLHPLDCNQLNTCPTSPETNPDSCEVVTPTPTVEEVAGGLIGSTTSTVDQEPLPKKIKDF